ncbi:DUF1631 family protein [Pleionea sp. CnH1-48]|uniref:DUF1631 family protein n=1 Tax=Pleionea sp. CnH1-48 TaxID=2954494 RepID=UPI002096CAFF|nr:DUF1631 family protein [Pleionea sp. CnH1-48]MCO7226701.1 DUF1631 domain-containing protein [Pleionea sp. CnH1-48]
MELFFSRLDGQIEKYYVTYLRYLDKADIEDGSFHKHCRQLLDNWGMIASILKQEDFNLETTPDSLSLCLERVDQGIIRLGEDESACFHAMEPLADLFIQQFFSFFREGLSLQSSLSHLSLWVMKQWLIATTSDSQHNFESVLEFLARLMIPIDAYSGKKIYQLLEKYNELIGASIWDGDSSQQGIEELYQKLSKEYQDFNLGVKKFEQRVVVSEQQTARNMTARKKAEDIINQIFSEQRIPEWAYEFLMDNWTKLIHIALLKHGEQSDEANNSRNVLKELLWALTVNDYQEVQENFAPRILPLRDRVRELFTSIVVGDSVIDDFLNRLENLHISILEGNTQHVESLILVKHNEMSEASISQRELTFALSAFRNGVWVKYRKNEQSIFCRVASRDIQLGRLILVNYNGARVDSLSFVEAKSLIDNKCLTVVSLHSHLDDNIKELEFSVDSMISDYEKKVHERKQSAIKKNVMQRIMASRKNRMSIFKERKLGEKRAQETREKQIWHQRLNEHKQLVASLEIGSMFSMNTEDEKQVIIQLALRLRSKGSLLFVNHLGVKVKEYSPEELATDLTNGVVELLSSAERTSSTIENVVAHQREKLNETT